MIADTRVGIPLTGGKYWHGGVSYIEALVKSIIALPRIERPEIFLVITNNVIAQLDYYQQLLAYFDGIILLSPAPPAKDLEERLGQSLTWRQSYDELFTLIDFYYPVNSDIMPYPQAISWIPDFQHKYLPDFFSEYEYKAREEQFKKIATNAKLVVFNSRDVESDFKKYYPTSTAQTCVLPAACLPEDAWYTPDPSEVQAKYNLPERFILCSNQFWVHKNHLALFRAIALIKSSGQNVHLVCTGATEDYRAPTYFNYLCNEITQLKIDDSVTILGLIPREDQIQLIRRCLFVVQPSLFEGLSLIVQECQALGKPLVLSDLEIHRQYQYGTLFNRQSPEDLAKTMLPLLANCQPGPDTKSETRAKANALASVQACGRQFSALLLSQLDTAAPPPAPLPPMIPIVTSLSLDNLANEQRAIASWQQAGFKVIAINAAPDITRLSPQFPDVEFFVSATDATYRYGKPYIYFHDVINYCLNQSSAIFGIVKADISLAPELLPFVAREGNKSIIFGSCQDTDSSDTVNGTEHSGGFDYIFFDRTVANHYPKASFCLGLYWWDYWAILMAIAADVPAKRLTTPIAQHIRHQAVPNIELWQKLGFELARYAEPEYAVTTDSMAKYQQLLLQTIKDNSLPLTLNTPPN